MKTMVYRNLFLVILLLLVGVSVFACGKDDTEPLEPAAVLRMLATAFDNTEQIKALDMSIESELKGNGQIITSNSRLKIFDNGVDQLGSLETVQSISPHNLYSYYVNGYAYYETDPYIISIEAVDENSDTEIGINFAELEKIQPIVTRVEKNKYEIKLVQIDLAKIIEHDLEGFEIGPGNLTIYVWINSKADFFSKIELSAFYTVNNIPFSETGKIEVLALNNDVTAAIVPDNVLDLIEAFKNETPNLIFTVQGNRITGLTDYGRTLSHYDIPKTIDGKVITEIGPPELGAWPLEIANAKSITIPNTVKSLNHSAFHGHNYLESVTIPDSVEYIASVTFTNGFPFTPKKLIVTMQSEIPPQGWPLNNAKLVIVPDSAISAYRSAWGSSESPVCTASEIHGDFIITEDNLLIGYIGKGGDVVIPNNVTAISYRVFYDCTNLQSVVIPNGVVSIGNYAFYNTGLVSVTIPNSVITAGDYAFSENSLLETVVFEEGSKLKSLSAYIFSSCSNLTNINIPDSVTTIGSYALYCCFSIKALTIPGNVKSIEYGAFEYNGNYDFSYIKFMSAKPPKLSSLSAIPPWLIVPSSAVSAYKAAWPKFAGKITTESGINIIDNKFFIVDGSLVSYKGTDEHLVIPDGVTQIAPDVLSSSRLTFSLKSVYIPAGVKTIGSNAFRDCRELTTVTFAEGSLLETIDLYAFYCNWSLSSIRIPASITKIGNNAFADCQDLVVYLDGEVPPVLGNGSFGSSQMNRSVRIIFVPPSALTAYREAWPKYIDMIATESNIVDNKFIIVENKLLKYIGDESVVVIPDNVTGIANDAFFDNSTITCVNIPAGVTAIGEYSFCQCTNLETVIFAPMSKLKKIGNSAFSSCSKLKSIEIPAGVTIIGNYAFYSCQALADVVFASSDTLTTIGENAFYSCGNLTVIYIPESTVSIGLNAFGFCTNLTVYMQSTTPPSQRQAFGNYAYMCIKEIVVPIALLEIYLAAWSEYAPIILAQ